MFSHLELLRVKKDIVTRKIKGFMKLKIMEEFWTSKILKIPSPMIWEICLHLIRNKETVKRKSFRKQKIKEELMITLLLKTT